MFKRFFWVSILIVPVVVALGWYFQFPFEEVLKTMHSWIMGNLSILGASLVIFICTASSLAIIFIVSLYRLADLNIMVTLVKEGTGKAIMRGGNMARAIIRFRGFDQLSSDDDVVIYRSYHKERALRLRQKVRELENRIHGTSGPATELKEELRALNKSLGESHQARLKGKLWDVVPKEMVTDENGEPITNPGNPRQQFVGDRPNWFENKFGVRIVGIPFIHTVYHYRFQWNKPVERNVDGKTSYILDPRDEVVDSVFLKHYVYGGTVTDAETGGFNQDGTPAEENVPVIGQFLLTVAGRNVYDMLFGVHNWLPSTLAQTAARTKNYIGNHKYSELVSDDGSRVISNNTNSDNSYHEYIEGGIAVVVRDNYGVEYLRADLTSIEPGSENAKLYREATTKRFMAIRQGEANVQTAEYGRQVTVINADAAAQESRLRAEGEARATEIRALAEALAIELKNAAITANMSASQLQLAAETMLAMAKGENKVFAFLPPGLQNLFAQSDPRDLARHVVNAIQGTTPTP